MQKGDIEKESSGKSCSHGSEQDIGFKGGWSKWKSADKQDDDDKEHNEGDFKNG